MRIFNTFSPRWKSKKPYCRTEEKGGLPSAAQKDKPPFIDAYSIAIRLPEVSFCCSAFGISTVRTPDSYLAVTSSGFASPT